MKNLINKLFYKDGDLRWRTLLLVFLAFTVFGIFYLAPEIGASFAHRFWRSGIFQILGPAAAIYVWVKTKQKYDREQDARGLHKPLLLGAVLFWAGLFGPNTGFKEDRKAGIPDTAVYYFNGKVKNATDSSAYNYYFKHFKVNAEDSTYIVTYGEEPGYNWRWRSVVGDKPGDSPKSNNPRSDEEWAGPVSIQQEKFDSGNRPK